VVGDEPAHGDVIVLGEIQAAAEVLDLLDLDLAGDDDVVRAVLLDEGLLLIVLVLDLAHELLKKVFQGHQARDPAVLVHDDGHVFLAFLKIFKKLVDFHRFGHEVDRPDERPDRLGFVLVLGKSQQVLDVDDALDVVQPVLENRDAGIFLRDGQGADGVDRRAHRNADHVPARGHDLPHDRVAELDGAAQEAALVGLDDPLLVGFLDEGLDFRIRGFADRFLLRPQPAEEEKEGRGQHMDQWKEGEEQNDHAAAAQGGRDARDPVESDDIDGHGRKKKPEGTKAAGGHEERKKDEEADE